MFFQKTLERKKAPQKTFPLQFVQIPKIIVDETEKEHRVKRIGIRI